MKIRSAKLLVIGVFLVSVISLPFLTFPSQAAEPSLLDILNYLGFTNVSLSTAETFSEGTYNVTLYAEFAGYADNNELSYYEVGTNNFTLIFAGPEGGSGYIDPPVTKSFATNYQFGLSMLSEEGHRYFTQTSRNSDGYQHAKVYENLDDPGMFLIGFENQWGTGDKDYNDMVFSLKPETQPPVASYLTVISPYGVTGGEGWYDNATNAYATLNTGIIDHGNGTRRVFTHWSGDASGTNYASSDPIYMDQNKTAVANWKMQYYLTVVSPYGTPSGEGWYDGGDTAYATLDTDVVDHGNGTRRVFSYWSGNASGTDYSLSDPILVDAPKTAIANWKTQYYLTLDTNPSGVTIPSGEGWYDAGTYASISTDEYGDIVPGSSRYKFISWTTADMSEIVNPASPSTAVLMDKPKTVTANYKIQYRVTFDQAGVGVDFAGNVVNVDGSDYGIGGLPVAFWWDEGSSHSFSFYSPLVVTLDAKRYVWESTTGLSTLQSDSLAITTAGSVTGNYKTQYYLTVTSPYGTTGGEDWYDSGSTAYATLDIDSLDHGNGTRRLFTSWSGDASGTDYTQSDPILMDGAKIAIASWKTQYYLTITTTSGGTTNPPSSAWYDAGTIASVTAIPDTDYVFEHWELDSINVGSANPYGVTMDTAHALQAVFVYSPPTPTYYLTVKTDPTGVTTIPGEGWYDENEDVPLTTPNYIAVSTDARYRFTYWDIDGTPQSAGVNSITVHMDANHTATAHYVLQYYLTVETSPLGIVTIPGEGWYDESTNVSLTAPSVAGYDFLYWDVDGASQGSGVASISVTMDSPHVATAHYRQEQVVVGGSTISIKSPLLNTWLSLNIVLAVAVFSIAFWIKRRERRS